MKDKYPITKSALNFSNAHELLFATILSAQCTDARVNEVTKKLFKRYRTIEDYANADLEEFKKIIRPTGFFNNKAKNVINAAKMLQDEFGGVVPDNMDDLIKLPGVARKTANVVLGSWYNINSGIAVDTHVERLSYRLGLSNHKDPKKIEKDLMDAYKKEEWRDLSLRLIDHGRSICTARSPKCEKCFLKDICPKRI